MNIIAIDTSTSIASAGLFVERYKSKIYSRCWRSQHNHGRELMPAVLELLNQADMPITDLTHIAVALGPGGFSAVRVGIAAAQGLAQPSNLPVIGVPTHRIQAHQHIKDTRYKRVVSLIPAGRNKVSFGIFHPAISDWSIDFETGLCEISDVTERFDDDETLLCGEGVMMLPNFCNNLESEDDEIAPIQDVRPPKHLLEIALDSIASGISGDAPLEPIYSRPPSITMPRHV